MKDLTPEKSIVPYLKYYIGCIRVFCERRNTELTLDGDLIDRFNEHHEDIADYKFIFRKLSSMTEEESKEWLLIQRKWTGEEWEAQKVEAARSHYLISKGFWIFGNEYFDLGLIIEKKL